MADTLERLQTALRDTYAVERQIGQGGMATVFRAEDLKHHRRVAIKVLRPELSATLGTERFLREIELAAQLQHPHIVPVYDSGVADGLLYYVMPYIEGESLRDLVRREGKVPVERAAAIICDAASGLAYAHRHGVVHRDIKPENIMLSGGHAVVADFGIARAIDASRESNSGLTGVGIAIGTPAYMSPEQATADVVDARSDQYALACVFYELVAGKQPFSAPTMQALLTQVLTGPRPRLSTVAHATPPDLDAAVQRGLAPDPKERFADIMAFADAINAESSGRAAATRESRRWKRLALVLPVAVAAVIVVLVLLLQPKRDVVSGAETIAVVPFSTNGTGVEHLGEGMVDLISGNLDGVGGIHAVESRQVLRAWQRRVHDGHASLDDAIAVARSVKAASVLTGSVVATGQTARLSAELYDLQGKQLARAQLDGPTDSVLTLADGLALRLLREIWRSKEPLPSARSSAITSSSMEAIRAYLDGERWYREGHWDSAQNSYERAVHADSTFAIAWYKLATTLGWEGQVAGAAANAAGENAVKYSAVLPPRLRTLLGAYRLFQRGRPEAVDSMRTYTQRYPDDADGWYVFGDAQFHTRVYHPLSPAELIAPFDRVLALDSALTAAAIHPAEIAIEQRDTLMLRRYRRVFEEAHAADEAQAAMAAARILRGGAVDSTSAVTPAGAEMMMPLLYARLTDPNGDGTKVVQALNASLSPLPPDVKGQWIAMLGIVNAAMGRQITARTYADTLRTVYRNGDLASYVSQAVSLAPILGAFADSTGYEHVDHGLAAAVASPGVDARFIDYYRAMVAIDRHQPALAQGFLQPLLAAAATGDGDWLRSAAIALDGLRLIEVGDSVRGAARVDSGLRIFGIFSNRPAFAAISLRYSLYLASQPATRAEGINRLRYGFTDRPELTPIIQYDLGKAYEAAGDRAKAVAAYGQFIRLWDHPDSNYAARVDDARNALKRLTGEGAKQ